MVDNAKMEKYAVVEDNEEAIAIALNTNCCPACGVTLVHENHSNVLICPKCGTKPFER